MAVMRALGFAIVALTQTMSDAYHLPDFSWDTLPVAWHSALSDTSRLSGQNLENLARYPLVTFEKTAGSSVFNWPPHQPYGLPVACQHLDDLSTCGCCEEDQMIEQAKILKGKNPHVQIIAYMNSVISYPWYRAAHKLATNSSWWLRDINGTLMSNIRNDREETWHTWDFSKPEVGDLWIEACRNMTDTGYIDGCFMDGCANYHPGINGIVTVPTPLAKDTHDAYRQNKPQWMAKLQEQVPGVMICGSNGGTVSGVGGTQVQNWGVHSSDYAGWWIPMLQQAMEKGVIFEAHGNCGTSDPNDPYEQTKLAAFLIAAQKGAYWMCGGWGAGSVDWYPIYDLPLGVPLGNATLDADGVYTRRFAKGTVVIFDTKTNNGTIAWGSASVFV